MPFEGGHTNDIGLETVDGPVCIFDSTDGKIKSGEEIFKGGVEFFLDAVAEGDLDLAQRLTRKNMNRLPYWQTHLFDGLNGPQTTDEEFQTAMAKL